MTILRLNLTGISLLSFILSACSGNVTAVKGKETSLQGNTVISASTDALCAAYGLCSGNQLGIRLLTREEYLNSVVDLLGLDVATVQKSLQGWTSAKVNGFDVVGPGNPITRDLLQRLITAAEEISLAPEDSLPSLKTCFDLKGTGNLWKGVCRESISLLVARAWRITDSTERSTSDQKIDTIYDNILKIAQATPKTGENPEVSALRGVIQYTLGSPRFFTKRLYQSPGTAGTVVPLTSAEMMTRIGFAISVSIPDVELLQAASANGLSTKALVAAQVKRLLKNPKVRERFIYNFFSKWIEVDAYRDVARNPAAATVLQESAYLEFEKTLDELILTNRPIPALLKPGFAHVNDFLAEKYQIGQGKTGWRRVSTDARGGLLQMTAFLSLNSADSIGVATNPLARGIGVLGKFLCDSVPPLTAALRMQNDEVNREIAGGSGTKPRNIIEHWDEVAKRTGNTCMTCHSKINPAGFPLESYGPDGKKRDQFPNDGGPIAYSGSFEGSPINSADDLVSHIAKSPKFVGCVNTKLYSYITGVNANLQSIRNAKAAQDLARKGLQDLIVDITTSLTFRYKKVTPGI